MSPSGICSLSSELWLWQADFPFGLFLTFKEFRGKTGYPQGTQNFTFLASGRWTSRSCYTSVVWDYSFFLDYFLYAFSYYKQVLELWHWLRGKMEKLTWRLKNKEKFDFPHSCNIRIKKANRLAFGGVTRLPWMCLYTDV